MRPVLAACLLLLPALAASARTVLVVDRDGRPVRGAEVLAPGAGESLRTNDGGRVEVESAVLDVRAPGFLPLSGADGDRLVLTRPSSILVRAVDRGTGAAVPAGRVRLWVEPADEDEDAASFEPPEGAAVLEVPLTDGEALADGLVAGPYRVLVEAPGFLSVGRRLAPGPEAREELLLRLHEATTVRGRVLAAGRPVPDARLRVVVGLPEEMMRALERGGGRGAAAGLGPGGQRMLELELVADEAGRFLHDQLPAERGTAFILVAQAPDLRWGHALIPPTRFGAGASESAPGGRDLRLDVEVGAGSEVSGRATWSDGEPAVGVPVVAELELEGRGFRSGRSFGVSLAPAFRDWPGGPETATGPEGDFVLRGLPPGTWRVSARPFDHAPSEPERLELAPGAAAPAPFALEIDRGLGVEGVVVDASGNPVPGASVVGERLDAGGRWPEQVLETETDGKGRFRLAGFEPGELRLRVSAPGFGEKSVAVGEPAEAGPQRVVLTRTGRLFGVVVNAFSGEPLTRFRVQAVPAEDEPESRSRRFFGRDRGTEIVSEDGRFEIDEVEEGRWAAMVQAEGFLSRVGEPVEVRAGEPSDAGRIELAPGASLSGLVVDADTAEPVEGAVVAVEGMGGGGGRFAFARSGGEGVPSDTTAPDGSFRLAGLSPGEFTVSVSHHRYPRRSEHSRRISIGEDPAAALPPLTLELEAGGGVSGRVLDSGGEAVAGAVVVATQPDARGRGSLLGGPIEADESGAFAIEALPAGEVLVRRADRMEGGVTVRVRKGETAEVLLQDEGARVFGSVLVAGRPVEARVRLLAGTWGAPRTDWGTSYELMGVPPGEWTLRVEVRDPAAPAAPEREERVTIAVPEGVSELPHDIRFEAEDMSDDVLVEGRVVDADTGAGLDGWLVSARSSGSGTVTGRTDGNGAFRLQLRESGEWRITAMGTGSDGSAYDPPETQTVIAEDGRILEPLRTFEAERRLAVDVRVLDVTGAPVLGATCMLVNQAEHLSPQSGLRLFGPRAVQTDALGRARPTAGDAGPQDLVVILPARAFLIHPGVRPAAGEVEVRLPRTGSLEIRGAGTADLLDLPGGWWLRVRAGQQRYGLIETLGDTIRLHGLPAGGYRVRVDGEVRSAEVLSGTQATVLDFGS